MFRKYVKKICIFGLSCSALILIQQTSVYAEDNIKNIQIQDNEIIEYEFTDEEFLEAVHSYYNSDIDFNTLQSNRQNKFCSQENGVNKIIRDGKEIKIHLSANTLNAISKGYAGALSGLLGWTAAGPYGSAIVGALGGLITSSEYSYGRVFVFHGAVYQYYYLQ